MKINKKLKKIAEAAVQKSFVGGKLAEAKVTSFLKTFKLLPKADAIFALTEYQKGIEREIDKTTLTIESATPVEDAQIKQLVNALKSDYLITTVETKINPAIIGGLKVKIGDTIFDDSITSRIEQVKEAIS